MRINFDHNLHQPTHLFIYSFVYIYLFSFGNILISYFIIFIFCFIGPVKLWYLLFPTRDTPVPDRLFWLWRFLFHWKVRPLQFGLETINTRQPCLSLSLSLSLSLNMEKVSISWFMTSTFDNLYISFPLYFSVLFIEYYSFNIMLQLTKDSGQKVTFTWMWIIRMTNISAKKVIKFKLIKKKKKKKFSNSNV